MNTVMIETPDVSTATKEKLNRLAGRRIIIRDDLSHGLVAPSILSIELMLVRDKLIERAKYGREKDCPPVAIDKINQAIDDYRKYLHLNLKYKGFPIAPSYDIDEVWHQHILFTRCYGVDCQKIFGEMRHHIPHFGRGERDQAEDIRILDNTRQLWEIEFGSVPASYDGMTALTSDNGWSGNIDLAKIID